MSVYVRVVLVMYVCESRDCYVCLYVRVVYVVYVCMSVYVRVVLVMYVCLYM